MEDFIGAKIVSINYPMKNRDNLECTEVIIEKDGATYSIFPHLTDDPARVGPIDLIIVPTLPNLIPIKRT